MRPGRARSGGDGNARIKPVGWHGPPWLTVVTIGRDRSVSRRAHRPAQANGSQMPVHDFKSQRLHVNDDLEMGAQVDLDPKAANYLVNVLRMRAGDPLLVFNGRHGEWRAMLRDVAKKRARLELVEQVRVQETGPQIEYLFAPLKRARLDYMVQKATELGVARLSPVLTQHTNAERINLDRMHANVIEAAEQCGVLRIPEIGQPARLDAVLRDWPGDVPLIFCDERANVASPIARLSDVAPGPVAVLVGPEGGFSAQERERLHAMAQTVAIALGPRIMRADTAAVAVLALVNATLGDWR